MSGFEYFIILVSIIVVGWYGWNIWTILHPVAGILILRLRNRIGLMLINAGIACMKGNARREFMQVMCVHAERMAMQQAAKRGHIDPSLEVPDVSRNPDGKQENV